VSIILLKVGFVLLPFYELLVKGLPYSLTMSSDSRVAKMFLALWLALAIGAGAVFFGKIRECSNKWILAFLIYIPISINLAPKFPFAVNGIDSSSFWVWKPFLVILCFYMMFMAVQSMDITKKDIRDMLTLIFWTALVMSVYVIFQSFGWEQFYNQKVGPEFIWVTKPAVVGNLGNSTVVSPYIAMCIPFALYLKKYWGAGVMVWAVIATHSLVAIGAMAVSMVVYLIFEYREKGILICTILLLVISIFAGWYRVVHKGKAIDFVNLSNGRTAVWKNTFEALKSGEFTESKTRHPFTGIGPGSYAIMVRPMINTDFAQVHNDYLEVACTFGLIGIFIFLGALWQMGCSVICAYYRAFRIKDLVTCWNGVLDNSALVALSASFLCISIAALGTFAFQVSPHNFYAVAIAGLLHNKNIIKGELK